MRPGEPHSNTVPRDRKIPALRHGIYFTSAAMWRGLAAAERNLSRLIYVLELARDLFPRVVAPGRASPDGNP